MIESPMTRAGKSGQRGGSCAIGRLLAARKNREEPFVTADALSRYRQAKPTAQNDLAVRRLHRRQTKPAAERDLAGGRQTKSAAQTDGTAVRGRGAHGKLQSRHSVEDVSDRGKDDVAGEEQDSGAASQGTGGQTGDPAQPNGALG